MADLSFVSTNLRGGPWRNEDEHTGQLKLPEAFDDFEIPRIGVGFAGRWGYFWAMVGTHRVALFTLEGTPVVHRSVPVLRLVVADKESDVRYGLLLVFGALSCRLAKNVALEEREHEVQEWDTW